MRMPDYQVSGEGDTTAVVSGSGHYPWAENPAEFNEALFGFLGKHFAP